MKTGGGFNEYGTPMSLHVCDTCGCEFSVIPAIADGVPGWENCLGTECDSYDPNRDADKFFDDPALHDRIVREPTGKLN